MRLISRSCSPTEKQQGEKSDSVWQLGEDLSAHNPALSGPRSSKRRRSSCTEFVFFTCTWCVIQKSRNYKVTKRRQLIKSLPLYKTNSALLAHSDWMQLKPWRVCKTAHVSVAVSCKLRQTWTESNKGINLGIFWSHAFILKWHTSPRLCHVFPDLSESLLWRK